MRAEGEIRPDPDEILQSIYKENRGKLTVFLGAAAGVGKTYTMLKAAHERAAEGVNVMVGWVETHGRAETESMLEGLPGIPPAFIEYKGRSLPEMDIDAILLHKPELVLVDELAHTNITGARHVRRFQDVEELLNVGIDVYTTLNIQHIESLNDVVAQITGVVVRETVPDVFIEQANRIQLIDIPPEDLIQRLKDGKVYITGQIAHALKGFFRLGNINALRELALRYTAGHVDKDMTDYMRRHHIEGPWPAAGRVMVCVGSSPFSVQLIRVAHQLSKGLRADFLAVHVDSTAQKNTPDDREQERIRRNLSLAEELGGKIITVTGNDIASELLKVAHSENITSVVVGRSQGGAWHRFCRNSLVDKLMRHGEGLNIYIIQGKGEERERKPIRLNLPKLLFVPFRVLVPGLFMLAAVTGFCWVFREQLELVNIALLYFLPVLFSAVLWGSVPSYINAAVGILAFDFFFVPPVMTFSVYDFHYIWSMIIFLILSFVIGRQTELLRREIQISQQRETVLRKLHEFSCQIATIIDSKEIARKFVRQMGTTLDRTVVMLLPAPDGKLEVAARFDGGSVKSDASGAVLPDQEYAVASWVMDNGQMAGCCTDTLPGADFIFFPLLLDRRTLGVFGTIPGAQKITQEEKHLLLAWTGVASVAVERGNLAEEARRVTLLKESEQLRTALFNSMSHELRTPIAEIRGAVSSLMDESVAATPDIRRELLGTVQAGAFRMERVIINLLDTARLESGMVQLKLDWCSAEEIIGSAIRRTGKRSGDYTIKTALSPSLPLMKADCALLEHVMVNLIDNAMKYSPSMSTVTIGARSEAEDVIIWVEDKGCGIAEQEREKIFEKFYRSQTKSSGASGTGLGLSICKSIVEAHGGRIWADNVQGGGARVSFALRSASAV